MKLTTVTAATASSNGAARRATARGKSEALNLINANKAIKRQALAFAQPDRPLSCLEVDFPIGPINTLAQLEINAKKPIYEMGKWWARRQRAVPHPWRPGSPTFDRGSRATCNTSRFPGCQRSCGCRACRP